MSKKKVSFADDGQMNRCRRRRNTLLALFVLSCVSCSIWLFWTSEHYGILANLRAEGSRNEQKQSLHDRYDRSKYQLRALISLLSSLDQRRLCECMNTSVADEILSSSLLQELSELHSEMDQIQDQQSIVRNKIIFQSQCSNQFGHALVKSARSSSSHSILQSNMVSTTNRDSRHLKDSEIMSYECDPVKIVEEHYKRCPGILFDVLSLVLVSAGLFSVGFAFGRLSISSHEQFQQQKQYIPQHSKGSGKWSKKFLVLGVLLGLLAALYIFFSMNAAITERRKDTLITMCDERARMLQDQFNVSMNHVHALAILVSTFHHGKQPSAIDQKIFAEFTERTAFERPLMSGVAYALRVLHAEREEFEKNHGWKIKKMETEHQSLVKDDYKPEKLDPAPIQDEYAPVIFSQETVSHIVSIDMMSGKEDRENILRARASGKGVLTSPFNLLKSNHLGVVLTFAVYNTNVPRDATPDERIKATVGYLGASFDVPSLVDKLLHQLASKQTIIVNLYDTTNISAPIRMYGPDADAAGQKHISNVDFGDPTRKHEMHCRFKHSTPLPWSAITTSVGIAVIVLLVGYIFHAALNRIEEVEDAYHEMKKLKVQAEAADVAKSQFLATVSHEIRTPMNGVLGMLQMLMDTDLDSTQQDFASTAQSSGNSLIALLNAVLDQAKIESRRLELEVVPFDLHDVLDNVLSLFSDKSQTKGIETAVYVSEQVPEILIGDPGRFRQIITNLVGNSVKFTEQGHVFVSVYLVEEVKSVKDDLHETLSGFQVVDKQKIWENFIMFESSTEGSNAINLVVTVEDTGVGIPKNAQSRIFTPFMQADSSTSRTHGGTGIGLSISKCLVDLMGGEIGFVSEPGVGSTFSFTAVFREGSKTSGDIKKHYPDSALSDFQGMRALVADGRLIRGRIIKYHLQRLGVHVNVVTNRDAALHTILDECSTSGRSHLDMVFVDKDAWSEDSGISFPRLLLECHQNGTLIPKERLPKMFLAATSLSRNEVHALKAAGYVDSILKPLRLSKFVACLQKALGVVHKRQRKALGSILRGKNILVVDDNATNLKVAACTLQKFGAKVTCADCGKEAIRRLQPPHDFDACFMDVQMPEMDGFEATRQIRLMERRVNELIKSGEASLDMYGNVAQWHVPILAMTADVIQATSDECLRCGMDDYVSKPFEEKQLYSAVLKQLASNSQGVEC